jgi:uncharacterized protein
MKNNRVFTFLLITCGWSWISWCVGLYYLADGINDESINQFIKYFYIGVYGPFIGAILTTIYFGSLSEAWVLLKKLFIWRFPLINYVVVFMLPLALLGSGIVLYSYFMGSPGAFEKQVVWTIPLTLWRCLYAGPLGEELGWRGFLLPELQKNNSAIKSSIIVGFIHFSWHLPLFWAPFGTLLSGQSVSPLLIATYVMLVISWSCIQTWLVNNSNGSVLIAILFHLFVNAGVALIFFPDIYSNPYYAKTVYYLSAVITIPFAIFLCLKTKLNAKNIKVNSAIGT